MYNSELVISEGKTSELKQWNITVTHQNATEKWKCAEAHRFTDSSYVCKYIGDYVKCKNQYSGLCTTGKRAGGHVLYNWCTVQPM